LDPREISIGTELKGEERAAIAESDDSQTLLFESGLRITVCHMISRTTAHENG
jgi:hypothetical protein